MKPWSLRMPRSLVPALAGAALLAGCAGPVLLGTQVQSFSSLQALPQSPAYRFERLPSQQATPAHAQFEEWAGPALHQAGLRRDDAAARLSVQLQVTVQPMLSPWAEPWPWGWSGYGWPYRRPGPGLIGGPARLEPAWQRAQVQVVVRDLAAQRVVFESQAVSEQPPLPLQELLPALFAAAMNGFPNPPAGPRRVAVTIGGTPASPAP